MNRLLPLALLLILLAGCRPASSTTPAEGAAPAAESPDTAYRYNYDSIMGTTASMTFWEPRATADKAAEAVMTVFREVNTRFSNYSPDSEISHLNATAYDAPFHCSDEMWDLLTAARKAHRLSGGSFDISAGPLMSLWGFHRKRQTTPSPQEIADAVAKVGLDKVVFDDAARTVRFTVQGMNLDSGGIAKGYALDLAVARLAGMNIHRGLIDLGGNIYCLPQPPPGRDAYQVGVRNPRQRSTHLDGSVPLLGQAIATSGDYERFVVLDGKKYSHIMDPRTGLPVKGMASVTIVARSGIVSDYLSTSIFVNRGEHLEPILAEFPDLAILIITADDDGHLTSRRIGDLWKTLQDPPAP